MYKYESRGLSLFKFILISVFLIIAYGYVGNISYKYEVNAGSFDNDVDVASADAETTNNIYEHIEWQTDKSDELEAAIVEELLKIPDDVLSDWLNINSKVIVVEPIKGSLDVNSDYGRTDENFTMAYNSVFMYDGEVTKSYIYVLGDFYYVRKSIIHEMGHFVQYAYCGPDYVLPYIDEEKELFISNECNSFIYYEQPKEYFAQMFDYVVLNSTNNDYPDSFIMADIINKKN